MMPPALQTSAADPRPPPWDHQRRELEEHGKDEARALLWSMRTGKSREIVDQAFMLYDEGLISAIVVLAPNTVHDNWVLRELPKHAPSGAAYRALAWSHGERDDPRFSSCLADLCVARPGCLDWLAINAEALQYKECRLAIGRFVKGRRFLLVCDESDDYGMPGSKRTRVALALARRAVYRRILTGTVVEDSPMKAFSQYEILCEGALGCRTAGEFRRRYGVYEDGFCRGGRKFPRLVGYRDLDDLRRRMAPWSSVVLREDCPDMPTLLSVERSYRPSPEQLEAYESMCERLRAEVGDVEVTAVEAAARLAKLQQILSGFLFDADGEEHRIPGANPRLDLLSTEVALDHGKVIVWCRFRPDVRAVAGRLRADGHGVVEYRGGMTQAQRNGALDRFQGDPSVGCFVGVPVRGLELSAASTLVWYSHTFHAMLRRQADERGTKVGGTATTVVDIVAEGIGGGGVDRYILDNQSGKRRVAEDLARGGLRTVLEEVAL